MTDLHNSMADMNIKDQPPVEQRSSGSGEDSGPRRKADLAYNHMALAERPPTQCKASRSKLNVTTNYFRIACPPNLKYVTFRLDFEVESTRMRGVWDPVKKDNMADAFKKVFQEHRSIFPRSASALVYNGTDMIYCPADHRMNTTFVEFKNSVGAARNGRPGRIQLGRMKVTPLGLTELTSVHVDDEQTRCALMQFLDCIITQEHRFDLTGRAARFVQHGHSLFKIPRTDNEKSLDVIPISKGEEVWLGLHAAVKTDSNELMLNADTSGSIFKSMSLNLIRFFAEVMRGYTADLGSIDTRNLLIDRRSVDEMARVLKGSKLIMKIPGGDEKIKKFEGFSQNPADNEWFQIDGRDITVAQFFIQKYEIRLQFPKFPCLKFTNKFTRSSSCIPIEFFWTLDEPMRFKGKLTDTQLDVFVKAVCSNPKDKKARIQRFCVAGGEYLGESDVMREWGVSLERKMVTIDDCVVLPLPHMEMRASAPQMSVDTETGSFKITETAPNGQERPIPPVELNETRIVVVVAFVETSKPGDDKKIDFLKTTLSAYGLNIAKNHGSFTTDDTAQRSPILITLPRGRSYDRNSKWLDDHFTKSNAYCESQTAATNLKHTPLHVFVFPRRNAASYATIKYYCDVKYGVPSQCTVRKVWEKMTGNAVTNTSAQNLLLKIVAKTGGIQYRLSSFAHKNVERLQNPEDPVMIIGIDVSHPGREERFEAIEKHERTTGQTAEQRNKYRGQHEKLPTARPAGTAKLAEINYYDCPRSVVSIVGTTDIKGSRYGVSSRVQRVGQEETVHLIEPFRERIQDYFDNTHAMPKHIIVYRDGASDTQIKKIAYEELESLERALESFDVDKNDYTITYIAGVKRHHTRFFRENLDNMPEGCAHLNCPPGTLVESTVTSRCKWDFFLQSHYGNIGTALPTRYTVVRDDWKVSTAFIQTVIFAHCFGNARCPRPLSIPVPLHYAHLAAKRAKVLFDHYKVFPSDEYLMSKEDLVREEIEKKAVTPHPNIKAMKGMHFA